METLHSLEWCHTEIDKISDKGSDITTLGVCVALLSGLGSFETFTDQLDLLFGLSKGIWSKQISVSGLGPIQRGTTLLAVKCLKRRHL